MKHAFNKVPKPYFLVVPGDYSKIIIKDGVIYLPMNSDYTISRISLTHSKLCDWKRDTAQLQNVGV